MFKLASLFVEVGARTDPFDSAMSRLGGRLQAKGAALGVLAGNLATSAVHMVAESIGAVFSATVVNAMDLGETVSKVETVFGDAAGSVTGQADAMAEAFGLAKQPMLDAAAMFGLMSQGAGMASGASAEFSNTMVRLAADAQSFYNVPLESALEKIRAGLSGESEPLRGFGVFLTEDAVKAEALAKGMIKAGESMTEAQKIMARASLIQKGLATATGDLERTEDSASNQTRKLWGTLGNLATEIGSTLLPMYGMAVSGVNALVGAMRSGFEAAKGYVVSFSEGVKSSVAVVGVMWRNLPTVWEMVTVQFHAGVVNMLNSLATLPANAAIMAGWFQENWLNLLKDACNGAITIFTNLGTNLKDLWHAVMEYIRTGKFEFNPTGLLDGFKAQTSALPEFVKAEVFDASDELSRLAGKMAENERRLAGSKARASVAPAEAAANAAGQAAQAASSSNKFKSQEFGLADFARNLGRGQEDAGARVQEEQLDTQKKTLDVLTKMATAGAAGVPMGAFS